MRVDSFALWAVTHKISRSSTVESAVNWRVVIRRGYIVVPLGSCHTQIGSECYLMGNSHVHTTSVGKRCVWLMEPCSWTCHMGEDVFVGGGAGIFNSESRNGVMIGGNAAISRDVPPKFLSQIAICFWIKHSWTKKSVLPSRLETCACYLHLR